MIKSYLCNLMILRNNLIERSWIEVNACVNFPIEAITNEMVHADISDDWTQFCVYWVLFRVSKHLPKRFLNSWNHRSIPSKFLLVCSEVLFKRNRKENDILLTKILVKRNTRMWSVVYCKDRYLALYYF